MTWILFHIPASAIIDRSFGGRFLRFSIFQTGVVFFGVGSFEEGKNPFINGRSPFARASWLG